MNCPIGKTEFFCLDLHAADAVYDRPCSTNFRIGIFIPLRCLSNVKEKQKLGRPQNMTQYNAFIDVCNLFDCKNDEWHIENL